MFPNDGLDFDMAKNTKSGDWGFAEGFMDNRWNIS